VPVSQSLSINQLKHSCKKMTIELHFEPSASSIASDSKATVPKVLMEFYGNRASSQPSLEWMDIRN